MSLFINGKQLLQYISTQILVKFVKKKRTRKYRALSQSINYVNELSKHQSLCSAKNLLGLFKS